MTCFSHQGCSGGGGGEGGVKEKEGVICFPYSSGESLHQMIRQASNILRGKKFTPLHKF